MNIVQVKIVSPITAAFGFTDRGYCIVGEEVEEGETIASVLRKLGKSHKEFGQLAFWPDPDTGELFGIDVTLNDHYIPSSDGLEQTKVHSGDVVTISLPTGC